jgi:hypothetical protein
MKMPFGFGWSKVALVVLQYAPQAIDIVEKLFGNGEGETKRKIAARETVELVRAFLSNKDDFSLPAGVDRAALIAAGMDEERFVEEVAKLNDAVVQFTNYVNSYKPAE